jgi:hypothetical protein
MTAVMCLPSGESFQGLNEDAAAPFLCSAVYLAFSFDRT